MNIIISECDIFVTRFLLLTLKVNMESFMSTKGEQLHNCPPPYLPPKITVLHHPLQTDDHDIAEMLAKPRTLYILLFPVRANSTIHGSFQTL